MFLILHVSCTCFGLQMRPQEDAAHGFGHDPDVDI